MRVEEGAAGKPSEVKKKKKKKEAAMFPSHPNNGSSSREVMGLETVQLMI